MKPKARLGDAGGFVLTTGSKDCSENLGKIVFEAKDRKR